MKTVKIKDGRLHRIDDQTVCCPFQKGPVQCGEWCPHFVVERSQVSSERFAVITCSGKEVRMQILEGGK